MELSSFHCQLVINKLIKLLANIYNTIAIAIIRPNTKRQVPEQIQNDLGFFGQMQLTIVV